MALALTKDEDQSAECYPVVYAFASPTPMYLGVFVQVMYICEAGLFVNTLLH